MKQNRRVFVLGGAHTKYIGKFHPDFIWKGHPDFGVRDNPTIEEHLLTSIRSAVDDAGIEPGRIQKGYVGNFAGQLFARQGHLGAMAARAFPEFDGLPFTRTEGACASGGMAIVSGIEALQAGYDFVLAAGVEVQTTVNARVGAEYLATGGHYLLERDIDEFTFPAYFAVRTRDYCEATGTRVEDLAPVVAKAYANANRNPFAHMHGVSMSLENAATASKSNPHFLSNEALRPFLKVNDCSQVSDGSSSIVLVSEDGLRALGRSPDDAIEILSAVQKTGRLGHVDDTTRLVNVKNTIDQALEESNTAVSDMAVAEVHDCFAVSEVMMVEALGLAKFGQGAAHIASGATAIDGSLPMNTGGGLLAFGHPIGATGIKQVFEIARQMRGLCGDYQVGGAIKHGMAVNMGGDDCTVVTTVLRNNAS